MCTIFKLCMWSYLWFLYGSYYIYYQIINKKQKNKSIVVNFKLRNYIFALQNKQSTKYECQKTFIFTSDSRSCSLHQPLHLFGTRRSEALEQCPSTNQCLTTRKQSATNVGSCQTDLARNPGIGRKKRNYRYPDLLCPQDI